MSALIGAGPAEALDETKPAYTCGLFVKDSDKDAAEPNSVPEQGAHHDNMEIKGFFLKHEAAKGAEATTVNIIVKDLTTDLPSGNTAINWSMKWFYKDVQYFVRAVADYSGGTSFEWGEYVPTNLPVLAGSFMLQGVTPGKLFEGPDGVVQLVIPQDIGGKMGEELKTIEVSSNTGKSVVPVQVASPSRGLSYPNDDAAASKWKVDACTPGVGTVPLPVVGAPPAPSGSGTDKPAASQTVGAASLPVTLASKKVKAPKKKTLALKLRATEKITGLVAQLRSAKGGTVGKGKLAAIGGKATLKLKLAKKLKKGKYTLDLVGKDATGSQRSTSAALTVR